MRKRLWFVIGVIGLILLGVTASADMLGKDMPDFTITTYDGEVLTLADALEDHDMVLINFWASWCGPCEMEFPYLEKAYAAYRDRVQVFALSIEPTDTGKALESYAAEHGMTFPVANGSSLDFINDFVTSGIPTSVVVDRFGKVCYISVGAVTQEGAFETLFDAFIGDGYTKSQVLDDLPTRKPNVAQATAEEIAAALVTSGDKITFPSVRDPYAWPMLPAETDGRRYVEASNAGIFPSSATLMTDITMEADGAISFDVSMSTLKLLYFLRVYVDGEKVRSFSGEMDWTTCTLPLSAGSHKVNFYYKKNSSVNDDDDYVRLSNMRILTGLEAEQALAQMPVYPVGAEVSLTLSDAREIAFENDYGLMNYYFGASHYYIVDANEANVGLVIDDTIDVDEALIYVSADDNGEIMALPELLQGDTFTLQTAVSEADVTIIQLYPSFKEQDLVGIMAFPNADHVDALLAQLADAGYEGITWSYLTEEGEATYEVRFVNEEGDTLTGAIVGFCTDETCVLVTTDEDGVARYTADSYPYHIQVISAPDGYAYTGEELYMDATGGALTVTLTRG